MRNNDREGGLYAHTFYNQLLQSDQFTFLVGDQKKPFVVHSTALAFQSKALDKLINGSMEEAKTRSATLDDINEEDFIRLCQFAYTGDYTIPFPVTEEPISILANNDPVTIDRVEATSVSPSDVDAEPGSEPIVPEPSDPEEPVSTEADHECCSRNGKEKSRRVRFRHSFEQRSLCPILPRQNLLDSCEPTANGNPSESYTTVFLAHARLYVIADKWGIEALRSLTLQKLHTTLVRFTFYETRVRDVVELIRYAYSNDNTPDYDNRIDDLRLLVSEYSVCEIDTLGRSVDFVDLMQEGGSFIRDWWKLMMENLI